jgi:hypothetical protein
VSFPPPNTSRYLSWALLIMLQDFYILLCTLCDNSLFETAGQWTGPIYFGA